MKELIKIRRVNGETCDFMNTGANGRGKEREGEKNTRRAEMSEPDCDQ